MKFLVALALVTWAGLAALAEESSFTVTTNGTMFFVDDVSLSPVTAIGDVQDVTVNLARGSTLRLENVYPVHIQNVTVDGVPVNGGRGALRAAGLTITGAGKLNVGEPLGVMILLR